MLCGGYALLSPRPPQQIWPDYYCNPGICNRWPSQFLVLLYLRTAQAFSWQHAPGSHPPSLFGAPVSCATVCDPSLLCDSFLVAPAPGAKPFFSRQTASVEQFLFVWRTISLCFLCFRFHNKHSRDRPPQQISKTAFSRTNPQAGYELGDPSEVCARRRLGPGPVNHYDPTRTLLRLV